MSENTLRITEIFYSLQGEARTVGRPTVFVRLTGCPLRCGYCDSEYAFYGGEKLSLNEIAVKVSEHGAKYVCVTGGEPLAQPNCHLLLAELCDKGYKVSLETSGAMDISHVDSRVDIVMDIKTPGSGEVDKNRYENVAFLSDKDQVKFVLCNRQDYDWAKMKLDEYQLTERVGDVLFSPSFDTLPIGDLAGWVLSDRLDVRTQIQLHKIIWGDKAGV